MRQRATDPAAEVRLFNLDQAAAYIGMGRSYTRSYMDEIQATVRFGKRVAFDRQIIDEAINKQRLAVNS